MSRLGSERAIFALIEPAFVRCTRKNLSKFKVKLNNRKRLHDTYIIGEVRNQGLMPRLFGMYSGEPPARPYTLWFLEIAFWRQIFSFRAW